MAVSDLSARFHGSPRHGSATDTVTDVLREAILDGTLGPSTWLREDELSEQLGVSRTPVREALRRLTDEQLTVREPHRGTVVTSMGVEDILAVYAVRETLEGLAAHLAAQRQPEGMVETLTAVQAEMADADAAGDTARVAALNLEFHRRLREAGGNPYLDRFLTQIEHAVRRFGATTFRIPHRTAEAIAEHGAILDAIAAGDADLAAQRAIEHMRQAREARIRLLLTT